MPDLLLWKVQASPQFKGGEQFACRCSVDKLSWGWESRSEASTNDPLVPRFISMPTADDVDIRVRFAEVKGPRDTLSQV